MSASARWSLVALVAMIGVVVALLSTFGETDDGSGDPAAAPTAPPASGGRLFVQVVGGKSQLAVIFPTGAIQILATEP